VYVGVVVVVPQLDFAAMALELGECFELAPKATTSQTRQPDSVPQAQLVCTLAKRCDGITD
jgi:hypothetical protein